MAGSGRGIRPAARARRALLLDLIVAAVLAAFALRLAAGFGVIAFFGLPLLIAGLLWIGTERLYRRLRRRPRARRHRRTPLPP